MPLKTSLSVNAGWAPSLVPLPPIHGGFPSPPSPAAPPETSSRAAALSQVHPALSQLSLEASGVAASGLACGEGCSSLCPSPSPWGRCGELGENADEACGDTVGANSGSFFLSRQRGPHVQGAQQSSFTQSFLTTVSCNQKLEDFEPFVFIYFHVNWNYTVNTLWRG